MAQGKTRQNPKWKGFMRLQYGILSLLIPLLFGIELFSLKVRPALAKTSKRCNVIAKVIDSSNRVDIGRALCQGDAFSLPSQTQVVCIETLLIVVARTEKDLDLCNVPQKRFISCDPTNPKDMRTCEAVGRGSLSANRPILIAPLGNVLLPQATELNWKAVEGTDHYRIVVDGDHIHTKKITSDTKMRFQLHEGNVSIIIQAIKREQVLSSSVKTFDVISKYNAKMLALKLKRIEGFSSPPSEKSLIKVAILNQSELLNESVLLLGSKLEHDKSTKLTRVLADLYLKIGMLYKSQKQYKEAMSLAEISNDKPELQKAEEGYKLVSAILSQSSIPRS